MLSVNSTHIYTNFAMVRKQSECGKALFVCYYFVYVIAIICQETCHTAQKQESVTKV